MRILLGLCVALLLGGCNRVITDQPLFFANEAADAPRLRDGVWQIDDRYGLGVSAEDGECRVDVRKPVNRWPKCADWVLVRNGEMIGYSRDKADKGWQTLPFVLASGDPLILQLGATDSEGKSDYRYFGVETLKRADDGRIEAYQVWPVLCGPPPPEGTKAADGAPQFVTLEPLPGLTIIENNCTTGSADAVFASARASRAWDDGRSGARWVRDTYP